MGARKKQEVEYAVLSFTFRIPTVEKIQIAAVHAKRKGVTFCPKYLDISMKSADTLCFLCYFLLI